MTYTLWLHEPAIDAEKVTQYDQIRWPMKCLHLSPWSFFSKFQSCKLSIVKVKFPIKIFLQFIKAGIYYNHLQIISSKWISFKFSLWSSELICIVFRWQILQPYKFWSIYSCWDTKWSRTITLTSQKCYNIPNDYQSYFSQLITTSP